MKTKNQTEHALHELAAANAANEDGFGATRDVTPRKQAWSPLEVWRTRVKSSPRSTRTKSAPV